MPGIRHPLMINGMPVLTAPAEIDVTTAGQLRAALLHAGHRGHATIVVDMTSTRLDHRHTDETSGTWTGLAGPHHGLALGTGVDSTTLQRLAARQGRRPLARGSHVGRHARSTTD